MEHVRKIELIELVAGRVDAQRQEAILAHIRDCPGCRERLSGLQKTWKILGVWDVRPPERLDQIPALPGPALENRRISHRPVIRLFDWGMALRFAAAVAIATMAGYAGGRWTGLRAPPTGGVDTPSYIAALGLDLGEGLSTLVLLEESLPVEEGRL